MNPAYVYAGACGLIRLAVLFDEVRS